MARLGFSLFSGGFAERAVVMVNGRTEVVSGPAFSFSTNGAAMTQVDFQRIDFPGRSLSGPRLGDASLATVTLTERAGDGLAPLFDTNGDGRIETAAFELNPSLAAPAPRLSIAEADADLVSVSDTPTVDIDLATRTDDSRFDLQGARDGTIVMGAGNDVLAIATATVGNGPFQIALGDGDDLLDATGPDDGFHILAPASEAGLASAAVTRDAPVSLAGAADTAQLSPAIFPPVAVDTKLRLDADGGAGADRFNITDAEGRLAGGAGDDVFDIDRSAGLTITPGTGADTVVLRNGSAAAVVIEPGDTGSDIATADTLRFVGTQLSSTTVELTGFAPGTTARIETDAPDDPLTFQPVRHGQLLITEPSDPTPHLVELIGVNSDQLEGLTVLFS